ncbi:GTPase ObgE [Pelobacter seleniigenes]|uniref:GTPase ObgE n=1 Tax=Pelobacter seleniigenes TaxID=407188 RepID=UPI0004A6AD7D|nr:GTPase ObgE [Pelobacter seleniigenes]
MKFVDQVRIEVKAGDGGRGCVSFRREKFVPKGGPDGGDGGKGGSVYFVVDEALSTLLDYRYMHHYKAQNGAPGLGKNMHGKNGESLELKVPPGTLVYDDESGELLADLTEAGTSLLFLEGGQGGRGNARFATSTNRAPRHAQPGIAGETKSLRLELKLLADVGLVGLPNAGKSTLISAVSAAKPKIADYPFTTLVPNLGVVRYGSFKTMVLADIPGLIAGASEGHGLGTRFLRHVERTDLFLHLVDLSCMQEGDPFDNFQMINNELKGYAAELAVKPQLVVLTKIDIPEVREQAEQLREHFESLGFPVQAISAVTGEGLKELVRAVGTMLDELRQAGDEEE